MAVTAYKFAGTGANNAGVGSIAWLNPGNIVSDNNTDATNEASPGFTTNRLVATNFGITSGDVPEGSTIDGVEVEWGLWSDGTIFIQTNNYQLWDAGAVIGSAKTDSTVWPGSETARVKGGAADVWSATLSQAIVTGSGFGVALWMLYDPETLGAPGETHRVDYVKLRVYYTAPASGFVHSVCVVVG